MADLRATSSAGERLSVVTITLESDGRWRVVRERPSNGETFIVRDLFEAFDVVRAAYDRHGRPKQIGDGRVRSGFASLPPEVRREYGRRGGEKAFRTGKSHRWTPEEARAARARHTDKRAACLLYT